jgi:hypothetical protein
MSDEAQHKPAKRTPRKPAAPRNTVKPKAAAATAGIAKPARVSVPAVPETPASAAASLSRRASALRLGLLTTTLAVIVGGFALFTDAPERFGAPSLQASGSSTAAFAPADPLAAHVSQSLEQDHRLAALALDIRQSQESISRLWVDAQALAESVGALAKGIDHLKSDVGAARIDAAASIARLEERLHEVKLAALAEPTLLGDPALQGLIRLGDPRIAQEQTQVAEASEPALLGEPALQGLIRLGDPRITQAEPQVAEASGPAQPATTGGLPQETLPQTSVEVSFNKPKQRARAPRPISGWHVHSARDDLALVQSQGAHYEVRPGEILPGAGIVRAIKKRGEQWVVLTSKGVITEGR